MSVLNNEKTRTFTLNYDSGITIINPFDILEERVDALNKDVNKTIRVNVINKKKKFRIKRYKFYFGRYMKL